MKIKIVLRLDRTSNLKIVEEATHYVTCMTDNPYFLAQDMVNQVSKTEAATTNLFNAINAPYSEMKKDNIILARKKLDAILNALALKVEIIANEPDIDDLYRIAIVKSAGMRIKKQYIPNKQTFKAKNNKVSGSVHLKAKGCVKAHEWRYTRDLVHFTNLIPVDTTTKAKTDIGGLVPGVKYAFFHRAVIAGEVTAWEGPIFLMAT